MDLGEKDNFEQEKGNGDLMGYHSANVPLDWRFGGSNLINTSMGSIATVNPMAICKEGVMESSSCSSAPMMDSFCPTVWDHPTNTQNLGFNDINLQNIASTSNALEIRKGPLGPLNIERALDMGWTPPNSMVKGGVFIPTTPGLLPHSLSQFPADSGFIERAARFSCFGGGNFGDLMNPSSITESMNRYNRGVMMVQRNQDVSKDVSLSVEHGVTAGSPIKKDRKSESLVQSHDEAKQGIVVSGNLSDEAEFSGGGGQAKTSMVGGSGGEPSSKGLGLKKRKRSGQDNELDLVKEASEPTGETSNINTEIQQKGDQHPTSTTNKPSGKHGKQQGSQALGSPKEEYIHIRARRGQATNSHSLAERVRREKISERMKFLQDLVPGCNKVTGKAVMLDEIINYVQSLQRQVEFLSMKLATVNPHLDLNLEGLLTKDVIHRAGPSSMLGYSPDMTMAFPQLHPCQPGLIQTGLPGIPSPSDALRRSINTQMATMSGGYKEPAQVPNVWGEDELHNVVHMGFNSSAPLNSQDLNGSVTLDHMKDEL